MVLLFVVIVWQRHRIRSEWFIHQLGRTTEPARQIALLNKISAELGASEPTLLGVYSCDVEEVRAIAIPHLVKLGDGEGLHALGRLLHDESREVREAAALALVFDERDAAWDVLREAASAADENAACAAVGVIGRSPREDAMCVLVKVLREQESSRVRAQAAESLIVRIQGAALAGGPQLKGWEVRAASLTNDCDALDALAAATTDDGVFDGQLLNEREIASVLGAAQAKGVAVPQAAGGAIGKRTVGGFVRSELKNTLGVSSDVVEGDPETLAERLRDYLGERSADSGTRGERAVP